MPEVRPLVPLLVRADLLAYDLAVDESGIYWSSSMSPKDGAILRLPKVGAQLARTGEYHVTHRLRKPDQESEHR